MMNSSVSQPDQDPPFLAQWMAGVISDEELRAQVSEPDYEAYLQLRQSFASMDLVQPDLEVQFAAIQDKINASEATAPKGKRIALYAALAVAASVVLFWGWSAMFRFSEHFTTTYGTVQPMVLSDQSQVILNANSRVDYPKWFSLHRQLRLTGEAFFKVAKGSTFTVETSLGKVQVLGTQFNVWSADNFLEVACYQGKVRVTHQAQQWILTPGKILRIQDDDIQAWEQPLSGEPHWISGESTFDQMPLKMVLQQLEKQYHCVIHYPKSLEQVRFTGSFPHHSLSTALQSICLPLQLKHQIHSDGTIEIFE